MDKSTGPGWDRIIFPLLAYCDAYGIGVAQVKEKFGSLRFYYRPPNSEALNKLIEAAELEASKTCEWCGAQSNVERTKVGWVKTLCPEHREKWYAGERWWIDKDGKHV